MSFSIRLRTALPLLCMLWLTPLTPAHAGLTLASSLGLGYRFSPTSEVQATNLMVTPGLSFASVLRAELGIVGAWAAAKAGQIRHMGLELRPMLVIDPPLLPVYGRLILAAVDLFEPTRTLAYGAGLGVGFSVASIGIFAEAGVLPRNAEGNDLDWILEGRAGVSYGF